MVNLGEDYILQGRTGTRKSTIFKLILGLYMPQEGQVLVYAKQAEAIPDKDKRWMFGYEVGGGTGGDG